MPRGDGVQEGKGEGGDFYTYQRIIWMINVFKDGRAVGMI
jgi:hypothetical protein